MTREAGRTRSARTRGGRDAPLITPVDLAAAAGAAALAAAVRLNTLSNGLIWDDRLIVAALRRDGGLSWKTLLEPATGIPGFRAAYYHPSQVLVYGLGWALDGEQARAYHALAVALHAVVTAAVLLYAVALLRATARPSRAGWWAAAAFAVLPLHGQAVGWVINACTDVNCAAFLLAAAASGFASSLALSVIATAMFVLGALLAKETAVAALVFLPLQAALVRRPQWSRPRTVPVLLACVAGALAYAGLRSASGFSFGTTPIAADVDVVTRAAQSLAAAGVYAVHLLLPLNPMDERFVAPLGGTALGMGALALLGVIAAGLILWRRSARASLVAGAWVILFIAPALTPYATYSMAVALHRTYIPSIGWVILIADQAYALAASGRRQRVGAMLAAIALALLAIASWRGNEVWTDEKSFWSAVVAANPDHALGLTSLSDVYLRGGEAAAATPLLERATHATGTAAQRSHAFELLGGIALGQNDLPTACARFDDALALLPADPRAAKNAAVCRAGAAVTAAKADAADAAARLSEARTRVERLLASSPEDAMLQRHLGEVLLALGEPDAARQHLSRSVALDPRGPEGRRAAAILAQLANQP